MTETQTRTCEVHGEATRLTCVDCGQPICPKCMNRTEVGLKCRSCAAPAAEQPPDWRTARSRRPVGLIVAALVVVAALALFLLLRPSGSDDDAPPAIAEPVGTWADAPDLAASRGTATAVVLDDGSVLVTGGGVGSIAIDAAETFNPEGDAWSPVAPMAEARRGHQAVVLDDGRVLVAGGLADGIPLTSAEVYDPAADTWTSVDPMATARLGHSLTVLNDGRVLAAGGSGLDADEAAAGGQTIRTVASAEIFDPETGTWTPTGSMASPRFEHTATRLRDGRVVMAGGLGPVPGGDEDATGPLASTEIYDSAARAFVGSTDLGEARANHAAALLGDDSVLVSGGAGGEAGDLSLASAEVFDIRAGTWSTVAPMGATRTGHTATRLADGQVLVAGGEAVQRGTRSSLTSAELFDFDSGASGRWNPAGDMGCPRSEHAAVLLDDGSVLAVAGDAAFPGDAPIAQSCTERFDQ